MRLGLFGGTFDPIHLGHLLLAEQCREQCRLDAVWFLPSANPPHKQGIAITSAQARVEMLEMAIAGHPEFSVSKLELERSGTTYTVDTLEQLKHEEPARELFFLIGADSLADLVDWREPGRILQLATIVAVNRGREPLPQTRALEAKVGRDGMERIMRVSMPGIDFSSTDIRRRLKEGRSIRYLVPRAVEVYAREHKLYTSAK